MISSKNRMCLVIIGFDGFERVIDLGYSTLTHEELDNLTKLTDKVEGRSIVLVEAETISRGDMFYHLKNMVQR